MANALPSLSELAAVLGGKVFGPQVLAPGPGHRPGDRSMSVTLSPDHEDGFVVHSYAGDDWRACRDHVRQRLGLPGWNGHAVGTKTMTAADLKARAEAAALDKAAKVERQAKAARKAARLLEKTEDGDGKHPYLVKKKVGPNGTRVSPDRRLVMVPMRDIDGTLHNVQSISGKGYKCFLFGGRVGGCFFEMGSGSGTIYIVEGFATGATVCECMGGAVVVAFNCGNLAAVATALRAKYPDARLVLCADDDAGTHGNPGLTKAREAADAVHGLVAIPEFGADRPDGASDFNDMCLHLGMDAVRTCIEAATQFTNGHDKTASSAGAEPDDGAAAGADNAGAAQPAPGSLKVHDAGDIDIAKIPPRGWLLGLAFCRKFLSGLIARGGIGKTTIRYAQYLALACGRELTKEYVHVRARVLIVCLEDDLDEVRRRIGAAMLHHGVKPEEVKGWLFYCTPRGLKLLKTDRHGALAIGELYAELRHTIKKLKIDLASVDPFIKAHGVAENDNTGIDQVCIMLAEIADEDDCAIDLVSHARKGQAAPGDAESDRGASAKKDAGRLMRTVTGMTEDDASLFDVEEKERRSLIRVDDGKINIAPTSPDAAWFKLIGVPLGNCFDARYPNGDNVQTVERWTPPDVFATLDVRTINLILDKIEAGPYENGRYSPAPNAKGRAAWPVIQEFAPTITEKQAKAVIKKWIKTGVLVDRPHEDPKDRHEKPSLFVEKRPGDTWTD